MDAVGLLWAVGFARFGGREVSAEVYAESLLAEADREVVDGAAEGRLACSSALAPLFYFLEAA
jgi:hypothetical protein